MSSQTVQVFCSFSESAKDKELANELLKHLRLLERLGDIRVWHKGNIGAGKEHAAEINAFIEQAKIILLLLSADYISDDAYFDEMRRAVRKHESKEARVIPVLLRPYGFLESLPISKLFFSPESMKPVTDFRPRDHAFEKIGAAVKRAVEEIRGGTPPPRTATPAVADSPESNFIAYLCDRRDQKDQLKEALAAQTMRMNLPEEAVREGRAAGSVPLVCLAHGDTEESLEGYKQRLKEYDIYELLETDRDKQPVWMIDLDWPTRTGEMAAPLRYFESNLAEHILNDGAARTKESITGRLCRFPGVVMPCYDFSSGDWSKSTPDLVRACLDFWNTLPTINSATRIITCLFFSYEREEPESNDAARRLFDELKLSFAPEPPAREPYPNLCGVVLDELRPIQRADVFNWLNDSKVFARFCLQHRPRFCNPVEIVKLKEEIRNLYSRPGLSKVNDKPVIPMETLAGELSKSLNGLRCKGR